MMATCCLISFQAHAVLRSHENPALGSSALASCVALGIRSRRCSTSRVHAVVPPASMQSYLGHENPSCEPKEKDGKMVAALAAGGHYDPSGSKRHDSAWGDGHLGDLPALYVDAQGNASQPVLAPRLKASDLAGRSLMLHVGGDNHADHPAPLGGGGVRLACGVIK